MRRLILIMVLVLTAAGCARSNEPTAGSVVPSDAPEPSAVAGLAGASCELQEGGDDSAAMHLTDVRVAGQTGFDRVVFEFTPHEGQPEMLPYFRFEPTTPPLREDPTGDEITVDGEAFIAGVIFASGVDLTGDEPRIVYDGPKSIKPQDTIQLKELREAGDFENTMNWIAGTATKACFKVSSQDSPVRIILDIEAAPAP